MYWDPTGHTALIKYGDYYYTEQQLARRENWTANDHIAYTVNTYKNSGEYQKLINAGKILYQSNGNFDYDILDNLGYGLINGTQTVETNALRRGLGNFKSNLSEYRQVLDGKIKLSDNKLNEILRNIVLGCDYLNGALGIDFDENFNPIENDNLYFAYGVKTIHSWDFQNSFIYSDVGAGSEGIGQNFRMQQTSTAVLGGLGFKNGLYKVNFYNNKLLPSEADAAISKLDFIERNGVKPNPTNYIKPTYVPDIEYEQMIPRTGPEWFQYLKEVYGEKNVSWVSNKLQLSKEVKSYMNQGQYSRAMDFHYEDLVRRKTGGTSVDVNGRQIDSVTDDAVIQAKRSTSAIEKPDNFLDKKTRKQIKATIEYADSVGKSPEYWFKYGVSPEVRAYLEQKGITVRIGLGDK